MPRSFPVAQETATCNKHEDERIDPTAKAFAVSLSVKMRELAAHEKAKFLDL
jgi:hypothetical protein